MRSSHPYTVPHCKKLRFTLPLFGIALLIAASCWAQDQHSTGWVVIPVAEYRTLHSRAYPSNPNRKVLWYKQHLRIDYDLRINGELATGHVSFAVDVLKNGWACDQGSA
jgi:hypothetical protein